MQLDKFIETIDVWIEALSGWNSCDLSKKPDEKSWSLGQLYQHILEETRWYFSQIDVSLNDKDHARVETSEAAKTLFERGSFEDKRFQGDPFLSENVKQPGSVEQLLREFATLKRETILIWNKMQDGNDYGKSEHPGLGYLHCFEWLHYAEMHMRHHLQQKARIECFLKQKKSETV